MGQVVESTHPLLTIYNSVLIRYEDVTNTKYVPVPNMFLFLSVDMSFITFYMALLNAQF